MLKPHRVKHQAIVMNRRSRFVSNEYGHTLIEMLAVLFVVSIICLVVFQFSHKKLVHYTFMKTVDQFELTIRAAQMQAIEEENAIFCYVEFGKRLLIHRGYYDAPIYVQDFPEGMSVYVVTASRRIDFNSFGNIYNTGRIIFEMGDESISYSINMGKGRFLLLE
ncbi:prepilin-type N-terminal cleavage/methylation domain-containing protein [Solibacillus sp. FSL H8-0538]|uniref:prepilin-type N-terminal cleavage/methylation domain-containing protein n=1 Tax=Solibacillus sp. FSL H8-0538 TaxID=2921400 RepID=UPI0030FCAE41